MMVVESKKESRKGLTEWAWEFAWEFGMKDPKQASMKKTNQAWESHYPSLREQGIEVFGFSHDLIKRNEELTSWLHEVK